MARHPSVLWAQRESLLLLTIEVDDAKIDELKAEGSKLHFAGSSHSEKYEATMELFDEVKGDELKKASGTRFIEIAIPKKKDAWWPRLLKEKGKVHWLKVDFNKWKDEDEEEESAAGGGFDFGAGGANGFDLNSYMSKMNAMGGEAGGGANIPDLEGFEDDGEGDDDMPDLEDNEDASTSGVESKA